MKLFYMKVTVSTNIISTIQLSTDLCNYLETCLLFSLQAFLKHLQICEPQKNYLLLLPSSSNHNFPSGLNSVPSSSRLKISLTNRCHWNLSDTCSFVIGRWLITFSVGVWILKSEEVKYCEWISPSTCLGNRLRHCYVTKRILSFYMLPIVHLKRKEY